ncbi:MAG TPA: hypothetical protein VHH88_12530, partial [Verrucomicrobiae bacterium]|nr:hypothetical protein [Verrucomicrobiae bacterium]
HLNGAGRHIMCDIAPSAGTVTYDNFSLNLYVPAHHVSAGIVNVVENDLANKTTSVNVTAANQINGFQVRDGSNRGDFNVQVGTDSTDDVATGVLLASVAENGRDNGEDSGINYCTAAINYARTGGSAGSYTLVAATAPSGKEYNINVAAAFFPYTNWLGGYARNSAGTLNGPDDLFTGSPGLALGTNFVDNGNGTYTIDLRNRGIDSRVDGVLLVCAGANDDDYALSSANTTDGTWNVWTKDNGTNGAVFEEDPVAFVFIPNTNSAVISGKFKGDGTILMHNGTSARFSVTNISTGMWQISIPGYSPQNGVLVISGENEDGAAQDNIVSSQPSGNNWIIESRDLPGLGLQTPADAVVSFVFIPSPAATLIAPANFATGISSTPGLTVNVTNNTPGNLSVTFIGREAPMPYPGPDFLMCVLPDTQNYARQASGIGHATKEMWFAQTDWIVANRDSANVAYVAQLGDIVQNGDVKNGSPNEGEWQIATNAMYRLEDQSQTLRLDGIPYGCSVGNHDQDPNGDEDGTTKLYNKYFGTSHYVGKSYYGGHYSTNGDSFFSLFSASGLDFIVFSYEFGRYGAGVLGWTEDVLATNQNRRVIVMTHYAGSDCGGTSCSLSPGGQAIYNELKIHTNFFLMMGGHVFNGNGDGEGSRSDTYNGATVHTLVSDYQGRTNGGDGLMRLMYFSPSNNTVSIKTYSPYTGKYETDANSQFSFHYNMQLPTGPGSPGTPYSVIGTNNGIAPGGQASFSWTGLQASKTYQWYVIVQNAAGDTYTSPVWQFSTSSGFSPSGLAQSKSMPEDPALAAWQAEYGVSASSADDDHDGQSNYAEYLAGTNPTNAASLFRIVEGKMVNGKFRLRWTASGGKKYRIQYSDQLRGPFTDLVRDTASETAPGSSGEASIQSFTNSATGTNTSRYYRVKIVP